MFDINLRIEEFYHEYELLAIKPSIYKETSEDSCDENEDNYINEVIGEISAFVSTPSYEYLKMLEKMDMATQDALELFETIKELAQENKINKNYYDMMLEETICYIQDIKIQKEERKKGYGVEALNRFCELLAGFGVWNIYLVAKSPIMSNDKINKFYIDNGFEIVHKNYDEDDWVNTIMYKYNG